MKRGAKDATITPMLTNFLQSTGTRICLASIVLLVATLTYGYYYYDGAITTLTTTLNDTEAAFASSTAAFQQQVAELSNNLAQASATNTELNNNLQAEKERNDQFAGQIEDISSAVGVLDKLRQTDKELLQKYSKVFFLNEHYAPKKLTSLEPEYASDQSKTLLLHAEVWQQLKRLIDRAERDDVVIKVVSAYRDFGTQTSLKSQYKVTYGSGANQFSADQGYSEHQLGTTIDLSSPENNNALENFQSTKAYQWLLDNAYKYGFVLSYPENNTYYQFEPWHWRFVGEDLASDLHRASANFYDWDQRKIDEYLVKIFD